MNYVGLFEGVSGFGLAFKRAGANIMAVCEIDKTCQSVLRRHHPETRIISDVKEIKKDSFGESAIHIMAGGFPCQDLSVAGLRKGLDGERSGLWFEFLRIITDHKPRIVIIENVPGLLSNNGGRDFAIILRGLVECGYGVCWRVFDSQYDGVAQRRKRLFIVGSLGSGSSAEILFERESSAWDSPPSREAGQRVADSLTVGANQTCGFPGDITEQQLPIGFGDSGSNTARCVTTGEGARQDYETCTMVVAPTLRSNGDAHSGFTTGDGMVMAFAQNTRDEVRYINGDGQIAGALAAEAGMKQQSYLMNQFGVRRLTPTECERLQCFPDGWTALGDDGKPISDSARYKMLGNAVCVSTAEWLARRVMAVISN